MTISKPSLLGIATLLTLGLHTVPAQATSVRTFVASTGNDANAASNCPRTAPCRNFSTAFGVTTAGGEIVALDIAGYGTLVINKAITIVSTAGAFIAVPSGGTGITINAGVNDVIKIDGLILDGDGVGATGIQFNTGKSLTITKSVIRGMTNYGVYFVPNASSALVVSNTLTTDNAMSGIRSQPTGSGTVTISLSRVEIYNSGTNGLRILGGTSTGTIATVVADSVLANNNEGISVDSSLAVNRVMVIRSVLAHNSTGLFTFGTAATVRIGQSTLTGNTTSWVASNGSIVRSYQDNNIDGNADGDPAPTTIAKK